MSKKPEKARQVTPVAADYVQLAYLLGKQATSESLSNLKTLANKTSRPYQDGDSFIPCSQAFCDGVEFDLGGIPKSTASQLLKTQLGFLSTTVKELMFKHAHLREKNS